MAEIVVRMFPMVYDAPNSARLAQHGEAVSFWEVEVQHILPDGRIDVLEELSTADPAKAELRAQQWAATYNAEIDAE